MSSVSALIASIARLLGVLIWPTVIVFFLTRFREPIAKFLSELGSLKATAAGIEFSATRQQVEAAAALGGAEAVRGDSVNSLVDIAGIADTVVRAFPADGSATRKAPATILWVDDRPENNVYEREALETLGVRVVLAESTQEALEKIHKRDFALVISDMGRPPDSRAGYTLLDTLRAEHNEVKFVIYASSRDPEHIREARAHGAIGCTNRPQELITIVTGALQT